MQDDNRIIGGRYRVLKVVGKGATATVYLVMDEILKTERAVKETTGAACNEAVFLSRIKHALFPYVFDLLKEDMKVYLVSEYVKGDTLEAIKQKANCFTVADVVKWGIELAEGLSYLHQMTPPIIHQDIKPANILVQPSGQIKLIDFGIAVEKGREEMRKKAYGSYGFAAPEQYGDRHGCPLYPVDERTDIYGLGKTMQYLSENLKKRGRVRTLNKIIQKCVRKEPEYRYQSADEFIDAMKALDRGKREVVRFVCVVIVFCAFAWGTWKYTQSITDNRLSDKVMIEIIDEENSDADESNEQKLMNELLFSAGYMCFHEQQNYEMASRYFQWISDDNPEACFYKTICKSMTGFDMDSKELQHVLEDFSVYNRSQNLAFKRVETQLAICSVYRMTDENSVSVLKKVDEMLVDGLNDIKLLKASPDGKQQKAMTEEIVEKYYQHLFSVNRQIGMMNEKQQAFYFERAIDYGEQIAYSHLMTREETEVFFCSFAKLYEETEQWNEALQCYETGDRQLYGNSAELYTGYLSCLLELYEQALIRDNVLNDHAAIDTNTKSQEELVSLLEGVYENALLLSNRKSSQRLTGVINRVEKVLDK